MACECSEEEAKKLVETDKLEHPTKDYPVTYKDYAIDESRLFAYTLDNAIDSLRSLITSLGMEWDRTLILKTNYIDMNNIINITYRGREILRMALTLAFKSEYDEIDKIRLLCHGYKVKDNKLFLYDRALTDESVSKFPTGLGVSQTFEIVDAWLNNATPTRQQPDTDGDALKGFHITTDGTDWRGESGSFIAIEPVWIIYGK